MVVEPLADESSRLIKQGRCPLAVDRQAPVVSPCVALLAMYDVGWLTERVVLDVGTQVCLRCGSAAFSQGGSNAAIGCATEGKGGIARRVRSWSHLVKLGLDTVCYLPVQL